jgi:hypothetical protein
MVDADVRILDGIGRLQRSTQAGARSGGVAIDEETDEIRDVLVGPRKPVLQREEVGPHILRSAGNEFQQAGNPPQHLHLARAGNAGVFGLATGVSSPTLFAWTADLSLPQRRGTGAGTLFIALELGILVGSGLTFLFYKNTIESARTCLFIAAGFGGVALLFLLLQMRKVKQAAASDNA